MGGLHGGDDPQPGHALDVLHPQHLRVLQAEADLRSRTTQGPLHGVDGHQAAAVADGVDPHLEAGGQGAPGDLLEVVAGRNQQPEVLGIVAVGLDQGGAAAAQGAVDVHLDATHGEPRVGIDLRTALEPAVEEVLVVAEEHGGSQGELAGPAQGVVGPVVGVADP